MDNQILYRNRFRIRLAEQQEHNGPVLIKEPDTIEATHVQLTELRNEYAIGMQLQDVPGVRSVVSMGGTEKHPRLALEYIEGRTLAEATADTTLTLVEKLALACEAASTLTAIHECQIMHREVSSSNILVARTHAGSPGRLFFIDFGIASKIRDEVQPRLRISTTSLRTLAYLSPEQTGRINQSVDYRTDLYSLGVTLYELFTGFLPFQTDDALEMLHAHIARQPVPPHEVDRDIPIPLSQIIL